MQHSVPKRIFVTGTGTGIGKTVVSAILAEALGASYWKPVQAGYEDGTDSEWVAKMLTGAGVIYPEAVKLRKAASPHIAAREEGVEITRELLLAALPSTESPLIIEGAGGLMVPLSNSLFVSDLPGLFDAPVVIVSRNMLGSINHSLLTASVCRQKNLGVLGWIFNDNYLSYEEEIVAWSGYPLLASIPYFERPGRSFVRQQAEALRQRSKNWRW